MADGEAAGIEFGEQRLDVAQNGFACRRIAHMADGGTAGQALDHVATGKTYRRRGRGGARSESGYRHS